MIETPIPLNPTEVKALIDCPLHYHFIQQKSVATPKFSTETELAALVQNTIQQLHAAGGPARVPLESFLSNVESYPLAHQMLKHYYLRLENDWSNMLAGNESMRLKISIAGVPLQLTATIDRLDKTSDGGILAILLRTGPGPLPPPDRVRHNPATTIYHSLVAATYPLKRPVRIQELWLQLNQDVTIELSEDEFRDNLSRLRQPVKALAKGEVMARPGLHCDVCPFKHNGCPVYAQDEESQNNPDNFVSSDDDGKIPPRQWIFKI